MLMILTFDKQTILQFDVIPPLYLPFFNLNGVQDYYKYDQFDIDPFHVWAGATSGSPILIAGGSFFGFLNETGGRFSYDARGVLTITCPAGQKLYYNENCNPFTEWELYNQEIRKNFPKQKQEAFWSNLEYCTWVEQKKEAVLGGNLENQAPLCEQFVYDYMKRIDKMKLPKGKLTIDDGWDIRYAPSGRRVYGNWEIDRIKFPHMEQLVKDMKEEGFEPGLWFAPFAFTPNSELGLKYPHLIGDVWNRDFRWHFIKPDPVLYEYYTQIFTKYVEMGFRKFKLDIAYGIKADMKQLLAMIQDIVKKLDPTIELECHVPDIFVSRYCDTVRLNDVGFEQAWKMVTIEHYRTCRYSASDKILNLDHLGTNTPISNVEDYLEHTKMLLSLKDGYPCVSLLPDLFGQAATDIFVGCVKEWQEEHKKK